MRTRPFLKYFLFRDGWLAWIDTFFLKTTNQTRAVLLCLDQTAVKVSCLTLWYFPQMNIYFLVFRTFFPFLNLLRTLSFTGALPFTSLTNTSAKNIVY